MNSLMVLVILCGGIELILGEELECVYKHVDFALVGFLYTCEVTSLNNQINNVELTGHSGNHLQNKNDNDVKAIYIQDINTKFIPKNVGSFFNITVLLMRSTQLTEIKSTDLRGMQDLEVFIFYQNRISVIQTGSFCTFTKLRFINMNYNQIENLPKGLFDNNLNLEAIHLEDNKISFIDSGLFEGLLKLNHVNLKDNRCISKSYNEAREINQLINYIKIKCNNPTEVSLAITTQNPIEEKQQSDMEEYIKNLERKLITNGREDELKFIELKKELSETKVELENLQNLVANMSLPICHGLTSFNINCVFEKTKNKYSCSSQGLIINHRDMELNEVFGTHLRLKSNQNVTELFITNSTVSFWSNKIFKTFPTLQSVYIHNSQLKELIKGDFNFASKLRFLEVYGNEIRVLGNHVFKGAEEHLTEIEMNSNQIEKILINTFQGLKQLKHLSLEHNLITELQSETFNDLRKLKTLNLASNKLQSLDGKLLQHNTKLRHLYMQQNNINGIGKEILDYSLKLENVDFSDNKCIDEKATKKDGDLDSIVDDIKTHCNLFSNCDYWSSIFEILI